ncbi:MULTISPECIES: hypothetical protein [Nocardia]|uniref:hypothetical protein n=1 Tax=Nocardia TaxID=1817 RepID=UPI002453D63D|nr:MULTISPECIES: hypothetical protein [Nocardia]
MTEPTQLTALARLSRDTAAHLRLLAEQMTTLGWQPDGHTPTGLTHLADSLDGMAMRCAMSQGDTALLQELTGRAAREVTVSDLLGTSGTGPSEPERSV